jgi:hypothetical protein
LGRPKRSEAAIPWASNLASNSRMPSTPSPRCANHVEIRHVLLGRVTQQGAVLDIACIDELRMLIEQTFNAGTFP